MRVLINWFGLGHLRRNLLARPPTIEIATSQAVLVFNSGQKALLPVLERMGIHAGPLCITHLERKDSTRIKRAVQGVTTKQQGRLKRVVEKGAEEACIMEEGVTYEAGGF